MPVTGEMQVWTGAGWAKLTTLGSAPVDPETVGFPPSMPKPMAWDPATHGEPDEDGGVEDYRVSELCELLLCPNCDMELGAVACTPQHAYLADHPMEHKLLAPLVALYLKQMRFEAGKLCIVCSEGREVVLATGDCPHVDIREDQVLMSRATWRSLAEATLPGVVGPPGVAGPRGEVGPT